jgi:hypothetical protein
MSSIFSNQIQNRNYLSPIGFKFTLAKAPKASFFCNAARIPEITLGTAIQPSYLKMLDVPGDIITYGDFTLKFLVDENLENYLVIHKWITGLGFPETTEEYKDLVTEEDGDRNDLQAFSDGTLRILNSNYNDVALIKFRDLFPTSLSPMEFEATDEDYNYFTAEVTFKYTIYNILDKNNNPL